MFGHLAVVCCLSSLLSFSLRAADSDPSTDERLRDLEKAVRQLEKRNAELENEIHQLKSQHNPFAPMVPNVERKVTPGNDYKAVFT